MFLLLDAPSHENPENIDRVGKSILKAAELGIKIIPITCSGIDKNTEYLTRLMSIYTNGTYVFLTDHSGIGGAHLEPTTDSYEVKLLSHLLTRLIDHSLYTVDCNQNLDQLSEKLCARDNRSFNNELSSSQGQIILNFYPNPTRGLLNIEVNNYKGEFFISDLNGKAIERMIAMDSKKIQIDLSPYPKGIYLLTYFESEFQMRSSKIILID